MSARAEGAALRLAGLALLAGGALLAVIGVVLLVTDDDDAPRGAGATSTTSPEASTSTAATSTPVASSTTVPATTTTGAEVPVETPAEFFASFEAAWASGDVEFLFERLHPAMFDRYTPGDCREYFSSRSLPNYAVELLEVGTTGTWSWETDGLARDIPGTTTVHIRRTDDGETYFEQDAHIVTGGDGITRWFTDCGTPKEGAR
jgi:hypothetical protein